MIASRRRSRAVGVVVLEDVSLWWRVRARRLMSLSRKLSSRLKTSKSDLTSTFSQLITHKINSLHIVLPCAYCAELYSHTLNADVIRCSVARTSDAVGLTEISMIYLLSARLS